MERLIASIVQELLKITITVSCSDKLDRTFSGIDELRNFRNAERSTITELTIIARSSDQSQRLEFSINSDDRNNVRISIDAEETTAITLSDLCEDFLASVRPWYEWAAKVDWAWIIFSIWISFQVVSLIVLVLKAEKIDFSWPENGLPFDAYVKGFLGGVVPVLVGLMIRPLRRKYFPTGAFAFGDGENRYTSAETTRTVIIAGFVVSIISSIVLSWFL